MYRFCQNMACRQYGLVTGAQTDILGIRGIGRIGPMGPMGRIGRCYHQVPFETALFFFWGCFAWVGITKSRAPALFQTVTVFGRLT